MKITVTQVDIDNAIRRSGCFCPIAHAIKREDKNKYDVVVGPFNAFYSVVGGPKEVKLHLPEIATYFITCFDSGFPMEPFEFEATEG